MLKRSISPLLYGTLPPVARGNLRLELLVLLGEKGIGDERDAQCPVHVAFGEHDRLPDIVVHGLHLFVQVSAELVIHACIRTAAAVKKNECAKAVRSMKTSEAA